MSAFQKGTLVLPALFLILLVGIVAVIAFGETPPQSEMMGMSGAGQVPPFGSSLCTERFGIAISRPNPYRSFWTAG